MLFFSHLNFFFFVILCFVFFRVFCFCQCAVVKRQRSNLFSFVIHLPPLPSIFYARHPLMQQVKHADLFFTIFFKSLVWPFSESKPVLPLQVGRSNSNHSAKSQLHFLILFFGLSLSEYLAYNCYIFRIRSQVLTTLTLITTSSITRSGLAWPKEFLFSRS